MELVGDTMAYKSLNNAEGEGFRKIVRFQYLS